MTVLRWDDRRKLWGDAERGQRAACASIVERYAFVCLISFKRCCKNAKASNGLLLITSFCSRLDEGQREIEDSRKRMQSAMSVHMHASHELGQQARSDVKLLQSTVHDKLYTLIVLLTNRRRTSAVLTRWRVYCAALGRRRRSLAGWRASLMCRAFHAWFRVDGLTVRRRRIGRRGTGKIMRAAVHVWGAWSARQGRVRIGLLKAADRAAREAKRWAVGMWKTSLRCSRRLRVVEVFVSRVYRLHVGRQCFDSWLGMMHRRGSRDRARKVREWSSVGRVLHAWYAHTQRCERVRIRDAACLWGEAGLLSRAIVTWRLAAREMRGKEYAIWRSCQVLSRRWNHALKEYALACWQSWRKFGSSSCWREMCSTVVRSAGRRGWWRGATRVCRRALRGWLRVASRAAMRLLGGAGKLEGIGRGSTRQEMFARLVIWFRGRVWKHAAVSKALARGMDYLIVRFVGLWSDFVRRKNEQR